MRKLACSLEVGWLFWQYKIYHGEVCHFLDAALLTRDMFHGSRRGSQRPSRPTVSRRGACVYCNKGVYTDQPRVRLDAGYAHEKCVDKYSRGLCQQCGKEVRATDERIRAPDGYLHLECARRMDFLQQPPSRPPEQGQRELDAVENPANCADFDDNTVNVPCLFCTRKIASRSEYTAVDPAVCPPSECEVPPAAHKSCQHRYNRVNKSLVKVSDIELETFKSETEEYAKAARIASEKVPGDPARLESLFISGAEVLRHVGTTNHRPALIDAADRSAALLHADFVAATTMSDPTCGLPTCKYAAIELALKIPRVLLQLLAWLDSFRGLCCDVREHLLAYVQPLKVKIHAVRVTEDPGEPER